MAQVALFFFLLRIEISPWPPYSLYIHQHSHPLPSLVRHLLAHLLSFSSTAIASNRTPSSSELKPFMLLSSHTTINKY
ncbi:MAG: hypothetical protein BYD32DRAFT_424822 [Podila humilis]|nr:MAG: hypothetical protein BYD32DRAFT_424822 [Podila humilis]